MLKEKKSRLEIENGFGLGLAFIPWEQAPFEAAVSFGAKEGEEVTILLSSGAIHSCLFRKLYLCTPGIDTTHRLLSQGVEADPTAELNQPSRGHL